MAAEAAAAGPLSRQEGAAAASLHSATRTPWEPGRLLEGRELDRELDRSDHERQHFRRWGAGSWRGESVCWWHYCAMRIAPAPSVP